MSIWVGRYAIVDGAVREHGPWFVERVRTREDESVRLLVLAEPVDERSAEFCAEVAEAVAELFARESLSVTGGLLRALRQAHANLAEWNRRSLREHQVAVGVTCVVLRDREVTIARAGPGVVYLAGPDGLRRLAAEAGKDGAEPLGGSAAVAPEFVSMQLGTGLVLLLTSVVERTLGAGAIARALDVGAERALAELFLRTREIRDMTAVLIAEIDAPEEVPVASAPVEVEGARVRPWRDPLSSGHAPTPTVDSGSELLARRRGLRLPSLRRDRSPYAASAGTPGAPAPLAARRARGASGSSQWRAALLAALALVVVIALAWCTVPTFVRQDRSAQLLDALAATQAHIAAAAQETELARSRSELEGASTELARARAVQPDDPRIGGLQAQVDAATQALDAVVDLGESGVTRVQAFDGVITAPFNAAAMVFGDRALWLLDSERGRLFRVEPSATAAAGAAARPGHPQEVYRSGSTYGGVIARDPRTVTWDASGQRVLLVDATPTLFAIVPGQAPAPIALRGARDLKSIAAIATFGANLYVLDPQGGEIWRYLPAGGGFDSERTGLLGGVDLADARGLAVDGEFTVLNAATARRFRPPSEPALLLRGIDRPLTSAAGIALDPQRQLVYVGDRGGRRVVVSDRGGSYRRQYRSPQFFDVRGLALSADGATVYVLTGTAIVSFAATP